MQISRTRHQTCRLPKSEVGPRNQHGQVPGLRAPDKACRESEDPPKPASTHPRASAG